MTTEPDRFEAAIEFCTIGFFGDQCPDCTGHAIKQDTAAWTVWNAEKNAEQRASDTTRDEKRRRNRKPKPPPTSGKQCQAIAMTTGKRCGQYRDTADPDGLCASHANVRDRYGPEDMRRRSEAMSMSMESLQTGESDDH